MINLQSNRHGEKVNDEQAKSGARDGPSLFNEPRGGGRKS